MTLVMNKLLDSKLTQTVDEGEKGHEPTETQEEDTMLLWDFVSMFSIEDEGLTEEEKISETNVTPRSQGQLKEDNTIMPKIKKLQESMKKIKKIILRSLIYQSLSSQGRIPR